MDRHGEDVVDRVARLEGQVHDLLAVVEAQAAELRSLQAPGEVGPPAAGAPPGSAIGRRRLLVGGATATAAAAVAVVTTSAPAAAANGDELVLGVTTNAATATTKVTTSDGASLPGLHVLHTGAGAAVTGQAATATSSGVQGASSGGSGVSGASSSGTGVLGASESWYGVNGTSETGTGVRGSSDSGRGVQGESTSLTGVNGISSTGFGVVGNSTSGVGVGGTSTTSYAVVGESVSGTGVYGSSVNGPGVHGESETSYGLEVSSPRAQIRLVPAARPAPTDDAAGHQAGEVLVDQTGALWACVATGTPGSWRELAGPTSSGTLHLLPSPKRVYDSRPNTPPSQGPKTPLPAGNVARTIDLKHNGSTVPSWARGALVTVLLVNAANASGNFTIWSNNQVKPLSNTLVWGGSAGRFTTLAVTAIADGKVKIDASDQTNVVLDVVGYYL